MNDLGLSSRQLVELATHIDRMAGRRIPTEEWLINELSGERSQIGGLIVATFITLLLVPVIYAIFVLDLKIVKWDRVEHDAAEPLIAGAVGD